MPSNKDLTQNLDEKIDGVIGKRAELRDEPTDSSPELKKEITNLRLALKKEMQTGVFLLNGNTLVFLIQSD